jgi:hypothetical protein
MQQVGNAAQVGGDQDITGGQEKNYTPADGRPRKQGAGCPAPSGSNQKLRFNVTAHMRGGPMAPATVPDVPN